MKIEGAQQSQTSLGWRGTQLKFIASYDCEWCFPCVTGKVESGFRNGNIIKEPLSIGQWEKIMITVMANGVCT